jgi:hypothetical protein
MSPSHGHQKVLIISNDPVAAALIAALVEHARLEPSFMRAGEGATEALGRVKPALAILVDALADAAGSDLFLARARSRRVPVAVFCGSEHRERHAQWAKEHSIPVFCLPGDTDQLAGWLDGLRAGRITSRSATERRGTPSATRAGDGTLVLVDSTGVRWSVYDRRSAERRTGTVMERHFVNDFGEARTCELRHGEIRKVTASALNEQLQRSTVDP